MEPLGDEFLLGALLLPLCQFWRQSTAADGVLMKRHASLSKHSVEREIQL